MVLSVTIQLKVTEEGELKLPELASLDPYRTALALDLIAESRRQNPGRNAIKLSPRLSALMSEVVSLPGID